MQLTRHTDYALRVLMYLAVNPGRPVPIPEMAKAYGISQNHLVKVAQRLVRSGVLAATRGRSGGVALAMNPSDVRLSEVVRESEPNLQLVDCAKCSISAACSLPNPLQQAMNAFFMVLDQHTLADLVSSAPGLTSILRPASWQQ